MRGGALLANLLDLGVEPGDVDTVLLSHLHADHVGWLADAAGAPHVPNAQYQLDEAEWDFWTAPGHEDDPVGPTPDELAVIGARRRRLTEGDQPVAGVRAVRTAGHTPGHLGFAVEGTSGSAFVVGDALHCPAEVLHPDLRWVGDHDPAAAVATRVAVAARVAQPGVVLVGPHFPGAVFRRYDPTTKPALVPYTS